MRIASLTRFFAFASWSFNAHSALQPLHSLTPFEKVFKFSSYRFEGCLSYHFGRAQLGLLGGWVELRCSSLRPYVLGGSMSVLGVWALQGQFQHWVVQFQSGVLSLKRSASALGEQPSFQRVQKWLLPFFASTETVGQEFHCPPEDPRIRAPERLLRARRSFLTGPLIVQPTQGCPLEILLPYHEALDALAQQAAELEGDACLSEFLRNARVIDYPFQKLSHALRLSREVQAALTCCLSHMIQFKLQHVDFGLPLKTREEDRCIEARLFNISERAVMELHKLDEMAQAAWPHLQQLVLCETPMLKWLNFLKRFESIFCCGKLDDVAKQLRRVQILMATFSEARRGYRGYNASVRWAELMRPIHNLRTVFEVLEDEASGLKIFAVRSGSLQSRRLQGVQSLQGFKLFAPAPLSENFQDLESSTSCVASQSSEPSVSCSVRKLNLGLEPLVSPLLKPQELTTTPSSSSMDEGHRTPENQTRFQREG